jgi:bisphosphoglycerate-dependent phosphoglycerate mutase
MHKLNYLQKVAFWVSYGLYLKYRVGDNAIGQLCMMKIAEHLNLIKTRQVAHGFDVLFTNLYGKITGLNEFTECKTLTEEQVVAWNRRYGVKVSELTVIIRMINALAKIVPLEKAAMQALENMQDKEIKDISKYDAEIIKRYLERVRSLAQPEVKQAGDVVPEDVPVVPAGG